MLTAVQNAMRRYWGYERFLPLQQEAMTCIVQKRDSVVVLPTGGGKSLCFQAPAATLPGLAVVVSPLIALMKDQVDALTACGVPAARLDSSLSPSQQRQVFTAIGSKTLKLLYLSPERLLSNGFIDSLKEVELSFIAIDEAHCVSMWGHDFRPEYRQLGQLKQVFPNTVIAAYTATATEQVRNDIAEQLRLKSPAMLVGSFDRPNLIYKVQPRSNINRQVCEVLDRHKNESGVIYCIRRKDVDQLCAELNQRGHNAAPYHAGMNDEQRKYNQEQFITEKVDIIVATVAFGMGIDKSNVRYVIHTGMPKSLEHYQQESGRAGRDGLEAECILFYSGGDYGLWQRLMSDSPPEAQKIANAKLGGMYQYCTGGLCRHQAILRYFGQDLDKGNCSACDVCLGDLEIVKDPLIISQKILSCIARLEQKFGAGYTVRVLRGSEDQRIVQGGHNQLSTYGLLKEHPRTTIHSWIEQLAGQDCIAKIGEYKVLTLTPKGWTVLKGQHTPRLFEPAHKPAKVSKVAADSWEGVDRGLFEALRALRKRLAAKSRLPAYLVFDDASLRNMARKRPSTHEALLNVRGVGDKKCRQYGQAILEVIGDYCR
ncbi:MAG: DNA helicase RecQ [Phycisphaerae bacterium]|nr:DNA helicase RecQ [Phycisphaerae bacterium]